MLREIMTNGEKTTDATYVADTNMVTGSAVVKDLATKRAKIPVNQTVAGFFLVNKERVPTGINTAREDMSDYDKDFTNVKENEFIKLHIPQVGEIYGTDQLDPTGLAVGDALMIDDGKFVKADVASKIIYGGEFNDAGNLIHQVVITDTEKTN